MAIAFAKYAGVSLPLFTSEADRLLVEKLPLDRVFPFAPPVFSALLPELPLPTPPQSPPIRLGSLWWPTGAAQWARAHFVVTTTKLATIRAALVTASGANAGYVAAEFEIDDGNGSAIQTDLYMLPPQPLLGADAAEQMWLLTLVDARYQWWMKGPVTFGSATWAAIETAIEGGIGSTVTVDGSISAFAAPSSAWLTLGDRPLPLLLDAYAHSVGRRCVRELDGTVRLQDYATAKTADAIVRALPHRIAGGSAAAADARKAAPASVIVYGASTTQTVTLASLAIADYSSTTGLSGGTATLRVDAATLTSGQAQAVASAWYSWRLACEDLRFAAVVTSEPNGFYGSVEWAFRGDDVSTRYAALPLSIGHGVGGIETSGTSPPPYTLLTDNSDGTESEPATISITSTVTTGIRFEENIDGDGQTTLQLIAASLTQMGAVTTSTQSFNGDKTFDDSLFVDGNGGTTIKFRVGYGSGNDLISSQQNLTTLFTGIAGSLVSASNVLDVGGGIFSLDVVGVDSGDLPWAIGKASWSIGIRTASAPTLGDPHDYTGTNRKTTLFYNSTTGGANGGQFLEWHELKLWRFYDDVEAMQKFRCRDKDGLYSDSFAASGFTWTITGGIITAKTGAVSPPVGGTPTFSTGTTNNWAKPTGKELVYIDASGPATITGIVAGYDGERVMLIVTGTETITFQHQDASSTAANRIITASGTNVTYVADEGLWIVYDATAARWRIPM